MHHNRKDTFLHFTCTPRITNHLHTHKVDLDQIYCAILSELIGRELASILDKEIGACQSGSVGDIVVNITAFRY